MNFPQDPLGYAIQDFKNSDTNSIITVQSDLCEDDVIPVPYLFRSFEEMPKLEQFALSQARGKVLDIGAGAGCHAKVLIEKGLEVIAIEKSKGAIQFLEESDIACVQTDFMEYSGEQFDTILLLMNGIGLAGNLEQLPQVLRHLKSLLNPGGKIFCDSTDIKYMYTNEDGSVWMDLNAAYYGEMEFNMVYKDTSSGWFPWLYIDQLKLTQFATESGFDIEIVFEGDDNHYLAVLKID